MKANNKFLMSGVIVALGFGFSVAETRAQVNDRPVGARAPAAEAPAAQQQVAHRISILQGSRVDNHLGERLGTVSDALVDLETGEVAFLLVREGLTALVGDTRPVPPQAFGVRPFEGVLGIGQGVVLSLRIDEPVWEAAPTLIRDQVAGLQQEARRREIYQYYGQQFQPRQGRPGAEGAAAEPADGAPAAQADTPASGALASRLLSADELMRATVIDAKNRNVGRIDDMIVDLVDGQLAFVVIRPDTGLFERADAEYAVAPKAIAYSAPDRIVLNLTESQLQGAQVLTEATLKQRAIELAGKDVAELRKSPPVYRFETRGKTGR